MILAEFIRDGLGSWKGFSVSGHADYSAEGSDIVCAAVTALTSTVTSSVEEFTDDRFLLDLGENGGLARMSFPDGISQKTQLLIDAYALGLQLVEEQFGSDYLQIRFKEG